jgi:hypothetical protein
MSERGSFVTEYIYCEKCFKNAKKVLLSKEKYLCSVAIPSWQGRRKHLPIIAGKVGGLYENEEVHTFLGDLIPRLEVVLCHNLRIVVIPDGAKPASLVACGKAKP